jgi:hypothetical protein
MRCGQVQRQITSGSPDSLSVEAQSHMRECASCRARLERVRQVSLLLGSVPQPSLSGDFAQRVLAAARMQRKEWGGENPLRLAVLWLRAIPAGARIAAVVALAVGLWIGAHMERTGTGSTIALRTGNRDPVALYRLDELTAMQPGSLNSAYTDLISMSDGRGK